MSASARGLVDTNVLILRRSINPDGLPDEMAISAVTLAELCAGVHLVDESAPDACEERARRLDVLQRAENEFDPVPFGAAAARLFGGMSAALRAAGRVPRRRSADLMIAATAATLGLPLFTTNPDDYHGLSALVRVIPVTRPPAPGEPSGAGEPPVETPPG